MTDRHPRVQDFATDFDHTDAAWVTDPYPIWDDLRQRCPVAHSDRYGGTSLPVTPHLGSEVASAPQHLPPPSAGGRQRRPRPHTRPPPTPGSPPLPTNPPLHLTH